MRVLLALSLAALIVLAGCAAPGAKTTSTGTTTAATKATLATRAAPAEPDACPAHGHATFRVFLPGDDGAPRMLDLNAPKDAHGRPYYDLGTGKMRLAIHMHQSGPEQGSAALGPAQLHYEGGVCVDVHNSLMVADVDLQAASLRVYGQHSQTGSTGNWTDGQGGVLRTWIQGIDWAWAEHAPADVLETQLRDGESILVAFGDYTDAQVAEMQDLVPAPIGRPAQV
ncbi:MAG: hypothetical protein QOD77_843 [Thermoplasmata archaeon]|jgi:hypothetical protein|nr:hypothetical protein [Thermoplasmata archaeon]